MYIHKSLANNDVFFSWKTSASEEPSSTEAVLHCHAAAKSKAEAMEELWTCSLTQSYTATGTNANQWVDARASEP